MRHIVRCLSVLAAAAAAAGCWWFPAQPAPRPVAHPVIVQPATPVAQGQPVVVQPSQPGIAAVALVNVSPYDLCYLYVSVAGEPWGEDQLGPNTTIPPGTQAVLELPTDVPLWDVRADDCDHATFYDARNLPLPANGVWQIVAMYQAQANSGYGYVATDDYGYVATGDDGYVAAGGCDGAGGGCDDGTGYVPAAAAGPDVDLRAGVAAGWYLGVSSSDMQDLLRGDCGFIDNSDLSDFCRGDCGFIDNGDLADLCRGDCGFIDDGDLSDFCRGDCGFIDNGDLSDLCRGDCGFIDDSGLADACRAL
ncbi:MAG: hypothetical protein HY907_19035 [Deltaproteobacteria bacterium]|nr:hypothetical protein [Deltaproteobacteria bacterium]